MSLEHFISCRNDVMVQTICLVPTGPLPKWPVIQRQIVLSVKHYLYSGFRQPF